VTLALLILAVFWLAYSNGANDNFKGVATLYGSGTLSFRSALSWATAATIAGSVLSIALAGSLAKSFSGTGLVPPELLQSSSLLIAVASAGAITIFLATLLGMPTSTTHALTGALAGIAVVANPDRSGFSKLASEFFVPLLVSPLIAIIGASLLYFVLHRMRVARGITRETCVCVGQCVPVPVRLRMDGMALMAAPTDGGPSFMVGSRDDCVERYDGHVVGIGAQAAVDGIHTLSGLAVCFARAVNDTPKIAALLLAAGAAGAVGAGWKLGLVAVAMALGGILSGRKVAETLSNRITELNPGQGLTSSLVTAFLVLVASRLGLPVSTTHVSCGSIFGIGMVSGTARWRTIGQILLTWMTTLPMGAVVGAGAYWCLAQFRG
jgi:PiT family inorganic phosphate transporter